MERYRTVQRQAVSAEQQAAVTATPLWFSSAVQLQTRLNRFITEIMREPIEQLPAHSQHHGHLSHVEKDEKGAEETEDEVEEQRDGTMFTRW